MIDEGSKKVGAVTRPGSVVWYERLAWAAVATSLASAAADPATLAKYNNLYPIGYPILFVCSVAGQLLWVWLIARKRQNWARWISLVVTILGLPSAILGFDERFQLNVAAAIAYHLAYVMLIVAVSLLFRRDAREWFARQHFALGT
jgi:FtsH-binding integral membrane protein